MKRVALVTAAAARALDEDMPPLVATLEALGVAGEPVTWDDPDVDWSAYPLAVVRSTWDYATRREEFVAWADRVAAVTRLENPARILRWNTDKRYLGELADAGIPVVPTRWIAPGGAVALPDGDFVVKPCVSAGAKDTARYTGPDAAALAHVRRLHSEGRTAMVQPYLARVDEAGETGLVYVDGVFSHAIRKGPILRADVKLVDGLYAQEEIGRREPGAAERDLGDRAVAFLREPLLYARVDVAPGPDGRPVVMEFEATEPSLFLAHSEGAGDRFARAIAARL